MSAPSLRRGSRVQTDHLRFHFDGREYTAQTGDTAASALLANGVRFIGRSVKYRRPRGIFTAGPEEPNALFTLGRAPLVTPNVPAPQLVLREGLLIRSQNRWPTLKVDASALLQAGGGFYGAGFYYKTFLWPSWRRYETLIRHLAGLGEAPGSTDLAAPAIEHLSCDVLIAGAGPAGLSAARAASRAGAKVVICEREPACGGELEFETGVIEGQTGARWVSAVLAELTSRAARILLNTTVVASSGGLMIAHAEPGGMPSDDSVVYRIRARRFVMAVGATERSIAFTDNDRPGVMQLGAAERYLSRYGVVPGSRPLLFGNHDRLYGAARRLLAAGVRVRAIVDTRDDPFIDGGAAGDLRADLRRAGVLTLAGHTVLAAEGGRRVVSARVAALGALQEVTRIDCDVLLISGGWSPALHGGIATAGAAEPNEWHVTAGGAAGKLELAEVIAHSHAAGDLAARHIKNTPIDARVPRGQGDPSPRVMDFSRSPASLSQEKRQFVDLQTDVTVADLRQALAEGFTEIEHIKRYTTLGVGTDQGRLSGNLGAAIVAELSGRTPSAVGVSRPRPPYNPMNLAALAGHRVGPRLRPQRHTALHQWHALHGGVLESAGYWDRPRYYRANGNDAFTAGIDEARRVRESGGIFDGSTLGKIEVAGRDAPQFLNRLYLSRASTIKPGRSRYMVALREDGMVLDDGLVLRLAEDRFLATVSSGHAEHMVSHFERYRDSEWSAREITLLDVTEAWAVIVVAGPRSRDALRDVLGAEWHAALGNLKHMEFASDTWRQGDLRVLRASFSGELAFELHSRRESAIPLWQALVDVGMHPYGLEALDILRLEKGYLVSSEMNGQTTPWDLGLGGMMQTENACVGLPLLARPAFHSPTRWRLVGIKAQACEAALGAGAQLTTPDAPNRSLGYITSAVYSPTLKQWIGLALVAGPHATARMGLIARDPVRGADTPVWVTPPVHIDPAGERMKS